MFATSTEEDTQFGHFVKLAEEQRRNRFRRVEAGDEGSLLKFPRNVRAPPQVAPAAVAPVRPGGFTPRPAAMKPGVGMAPKFGVSRFGGAKPRPAAVRPVAPHVGMKRPFSGVRPAVAKVTRL